MPTTCCAPGCTQRHSKSSDVHFFRLPKDEERRKKWIFSMKRTQADNPNRLWEPSYHDRICSLHFISDTRLPEKGPSTGAIIGGIIGVILLLTVIGTGIAMYRKHKNKLSGEGPPKYKPPPPNKANNSTSRPMMPATAPVTESRPLYYSTQSPEPVTDLDGYQEDDVDEDLEAHDGEHYFSAAPSGWDDPVNNEVPPPYMRPDNGPRDYNGDLAIGRGESFVSSAMIV